MNKVLKVLFSFTLLCCTTAYATYAPVDSVLRIPDGVTGLSSSDITNKSEIKKLILPAEIMTISSFTFQYCSNLEEVIFLGNIPTFRVGAFYGCNAITRVEVQPGYVNSLATAASDYDYDRPGFQGQAILYEANTPVTDLYLSGRVTAYAFQGFKNSFKVHLTGSTSFGESVFYGRSVEGFYVDNFSTWCMSGSGSRLFYDETKLYVNNQLVQGDIVIPSDVSLIGMCSFFGYNYISSVTIPSNVTYIGYSAFAASSIKSLKSSCSNFWQDAILSNCTQLEEITFDCGAVDSNNAAIEFGEKCFRGCTALKTVNLDHSYFAYLVDTSFPSSQIESVYVSDIDTWCKGASCLGYKATLYIDGVAPTQLTIPEGISELYANAFYKQPYELITLPKSLTTIGNNALSDVKSIECKAITPPTITPTTFSNVDKTTAILTVPKNRQSAYKAADYWDEFVNISGSTFGENIPATAVSLSQNELMIEVGETAQLESTIAPINATDDFVWSSANDNIATVVDGLVTAKNPGTVVIKYASLDNLAVFATCSVRVYKPITSITFSADTVDVNVGQKKSLSLSIEPTDASINTIDWTSSDPSVVSVDEYGNITGLKSGSVTITAKTTDGTNLEAFCTVNSIQLVTEVQLDIYSQELAVNTGGYVKAIITPEDASNKELIWTIEDELIARLTDTTYGYKIIWGVKAGKTNLTVKAADEGNVSATAEFTVYNEVSSLTFTNDSIKVVRGETYQLNAVVEPEDAWYQDLEWSSSNPEVVSVDENGLLTAVAKGDARIYARTKSVNDEYTQEFTAVCYVQVIVLTESIEMTLPKTSINIGETLLLNQYVKVTPDDATNVDNFRWESDNTSVATVTIGGEVRGISQGQATITIYTVDGTNLSTTCVVTVVQPISDIVLNETDATLNEGQTIQLTATVSPELADNKTLQWTSSNDAVATVDQSGLVTAISQGSAVITVSSTDGSDVSATCNITVCKLISDIVLNETDATLNTGQTIQLTATVLPELADNKTLQWTSSNKAIATVDQTGLVSAKSAGNAIITVRSTDGAGASASCNLTVLQPVASVSITGSNSCRSIKVGETYQLTATVYPQNASNTNLCWTSSNERVAVVQNGLVTGIRGGDVFITATSTDGTDMSDSCYFQIQYTSDPITFKEESLTLNVGESFTLSPVFSDEFDTENSLVWSSSDNKVVTVSNEGVITAIGQGKATVTVEAENGPDAYAFCEVEVRALISDIVLNETEATLNEGQTIQLTATVLPELADDKSLQWVSSNDAVATVDQYGLVTAISQGLAVITANSTDGSNISASCNITVIRPVTSIALSETEIVMSAGEYRILTAEVAPTDATTTTLQWNTSNDAVARVENGIVVAVADGEAIITAAANDGSGVSASCNVIVRTLVTEIILSDSTLSLREGEFKNITVTVLPDNATNAEVEWTSSDDNVASVQNGLILAHKKGSAVITVSATDDSGVYAECMVEVSEDSGIVNVTADGISFTTEPMIVTVRGITDDTVICLFDMSGKLLYIGNDSRIEVAQNGIYILAINNKAFKIRL